MPIHYVSEGAVRVAEMIVESKLFTVQQALYFAVSIHVSPDHVSEGYIACFSPQSALVLSPALVLIYLVLSV